MFLSKAQAGIQQPACASEVLRRRLAPDEPRALVPLRAEALPPVQERVQLLRQPAGLARCTGIVQLRPPQSEPLSTVRFHGHRPDAHVKGECTHWCQPGALEKVVHLLYGLLLAHPQQRSCEIFSRLKGRAFTAAYATRLHARMSTPSESCASFGPETTTAVSGGTHLFPARAESWWKLRTFNQRVAVISPGSPEPCIRAASDISPIDTPDWLLTGQMTEPVTGSLSSGARGGLRAFWRLDMRFIYIQVWRKLDSQ